MSKRSFFQRLTGGIRMPEEEEDEEVFEAPNLRDMRRGEFNRSIDQQPITTINVKDKDKHARNKEDEEEPEDGQLSVDVYQTPGEIVVQTMVAGVKPEDLQINISRDTLTIKGKREEARTINEDNYFAKELYWGTFSRTILLPQEVDPEEAEAIERHGLLVIKMPKLDKNRKTNLKVKSI